MIALLVIRPAGPLRIVDQRPNRRDERPRDQQQVVTENPHEIKQRVESRGYLPGFYGGNVDLRQSNFASQVSLRPMTGVTRRNEAVQKVGGQTL
jgi:hypothetical protein